MDKNRTVAGSYSSRRSYNKSCWQYWKILNLKKDNTIIYDLEGKDTVYQVNDSHMHLVNYGYY